MAAQKTGKNIQVRLLKSPIGAHPKHRATIQALGLRKIGQVKEIPANEACLGMVRSVSYLVEIQHV